MKQYRPSLNVIIKADDGTEHPLIETIHIYLRSINEEERIENAFSNAISPCMTFRTICMILIWGNQKSFVVFVVDYSTEFQEFAEYLMKED